MGVVSHKNFFACFFNLTNSIVGVAFLAMPYIITTVGITGTILLICIFAILNFISLQLMADVWISTNGKLKNNHQSSIIISSYLRETPLSSSLTELHEYFDYLKVPFLKIIYDIAVILSMFGSLCVLVIVAKTCLFSVTSIYEDESKRVFDSSFVAVFACLVFFPTIIKTIGNQWSFSVISLVCVAYIILSIIIRGSQALLSSDFDAQIFTQPPFSFASLGSVGVIAFSFACQMNAMPIYSELEHPTKLRITLLNILSLFTAAVIYILIAYFGFVSQGAETTSNILLGYDNSDIPMLVAKVLMAVKAFFTFPLMSHSLLINADDLVTSIISLIKHSIEITISKIEKKENGGGSGGTMHLSLLKFMKKRNKTHEDSEDEDEDDDDDDNNATKTKKKKIYYYLKRCIYTGVFVAGSSAIGFFFDDISPVISLTGAIADSSISLLFPGFLCVSCVVYQKSKEHRTTTAHNVSKELYNTGMMLVTTSVVVTWITIFGLLTNDL